MLYLNFLILYSNVSDLDAMGKPGSGLAKGHLVWPGSFDQCNGIPNSKYCLAGTEINNNPAAVSELSHLDYLLIQ